MVESENKVPDNVSKQLPDNTLQGLPVCLVAHVYTFCVLSAHAAFAATAIHFSAVARLASASPRDVRVSWAQMTWWNRSSCGRWTPPPALLRMRPHALRVGIVCSSKVIALSALGTMVSVRRLHLNLKGAPKDPLEYCWLSGLTALLELSGTLLVPMFVHLPVSLRTLDVSYPHSETKKTRVVGSAATTSALPGDGWIGFAKKLTALRVLHLRNHNASTSVLLWLKATLPSLTSLYLDAVHETPTNEPLPRASFSASSFSSPSVLLASGPDFRDLSAFGCRSWPSTSLLTLVSWLSPLRHLTISLEENQHNAAADVALLVVRLFGRLVSLTCGCRYTPAHVGATFLKALRRLKTLDGFADKPFWLSLRRLRFLGWVQQFTLAQLVVFPNLELFGADHIRDTNDRRRHGTDPDPDPDADATKNTLRLREIELDVCESLVYLYQKTPHLTALRVGNLTGRGDGLRALTALTSLSLGHRRYPREDRVYGEVAYLADTLQSVAAPEMLWDKHPDRFLGNLPPSLVELVTHRDWVGDTLRRALRARNIVLRDLPFAEAENLAMPSDWTPS